jgi:RNA recognition motif-containing protein
VPSVNIVITCILLQYLILLFSILNSYGGIASSKAIIDQKTGECKGYGFAMFEREQDCERAIEDLNKGGLQASFARVGQVTRERMYYCCFFLLTYLLFYYS